MAYGGNDRWTGHDGDAEDLPTSLRRRREQISERIEQLHERHEQLSGRLAQGSSPEKAADARVAAAVGRPAQAETIITDVEGKIAKAKTDHPELAGKEFTLSQMWEAGSIGVLRSAAALDLILRPWDTSRPPVTAHLHIHAALPSLRADAPAGAAPAARAAPSVAATAAGLTSRV